MKQLRIAVLILICGVGSLKYLPLVSAQSGGKRLDWKEELTKAQAAIVREPKSSFWHNQAGIAYDALGEVSNAERELKLAAKLDSTNPAGYYALYAFYKRRGTLSQRRRALLNALEIDGENPLGHFELAAILEKEGYLVESLREYQAAKHLIFGVKAAQYVDARGNPYQVDVVRREVNGCINRVTKLQASKKLEK